MTTRDWMQFSDNYALYLQEFEKIFNTEKTLIAHSEGYTAFYIIKDNDEKLVHWELRKKVESISLKYSLNLQFSILLTGNRENLKLSKYPPIPWKDYLQNCYNSQNSNVIINLQNNGIQIDSSLQNQIILDKKHQLNELLIAINNTNLAQEIEICDKEMKKIENIITILKQNEILKLVKMN